MCLLLRRLSFSFWFKTLICHEIMLKIFIDLYTCSEKLFPRIYVEMHLIPFFYTLSKVKSVVYTFLPKRNIYAITVPVGTSKCSYRYCACVPIAKKGYHYFVFSNRTILRPYYLLCLPNFCSWMNYVNMVNITLALHKYAEQ